MYSKDGLKIEADEEAYEGELLELLYVSSETTVFGEAPKNLPFYIIGKWLDGEYLYTDIFQTHNGVKVLLSPHEDELRLLVTEIPKDLTLYHIINSLYRLADNIETKLTKTVPISPARTVKI